MRYILKDVRQWKFKYDLFKFGVLTMVLVVFWGGIELYSTYTSTSIPKDYSMQVEPLNPSLDLEMIAEIEERVEISEDFQVVKLIEEETEVELEEDPVVTPEISEELAEPETATESGEE